jgi:hypothetical protein
LDGSCNGMDTAGWRYKTKGAKQAAGYMHRDSGCEIHGVLRAWLSNRPMDVAWLPGGTACIKMYIGDDQTACRTKKPRLLAS